MLYLGLPIKNGDFPQKKSGDFTDFTQKSGVFFRQKTIWEFQLTPFNFGMKSLRKWDFFAKLKKFHQCF
jgi:hypothetical protein